jgi:hypothetical protein
MVRASAPSAALPRDCGDGVVVLLLLRTHWLSLQASKPVTASAAGAGAGVGAAAKSTAPLGLLPGQQHSLQDSARCVAYWKAIMQVMVGSA